MEFNLNVTSWCRTYILLVESDVRTFLTPTMCLKLCQSNWCLKQELWINASKTTVVLQTGRKYAKIKYFWKVYYYNNPRTPNLEVILDQRLNWNKQMNKIANKPIMAYWSCQRLCGKTWELQPKMIYWSYSYKTHDYMRFFSMVAKTQRRGSTSQILESSKDGLLRNYRCIVHLQL